MIFPRTNGYDGGVVYKILIHKLAVVLQKADNEDTANYGRDSDMDTGWVEGGVVTPVGWQITLCDPIDKWRPVVLR